jgi:CubicO group peptidase (beta-lactamase class C family)
LRCFDGKDVRNAQKIAEIAGPFLGNRQFTHIYAESGRFDSALPSVHFSYLPEGQDTFDLASMTKALVTTPLTFNTSMTACLSLSGTVKEWLAGFPTALNSRIFDLTIADLLSHKSGLPSWRNFWIHHLGPGPADYGSRHEHIERILNRFSPEILDSGNFVYSDLGYILLGLILEKRSRVSLAEIFTQFKREQLNFAGEKEWLNFALPAMDSRRAIPTSFCAIRGRNLAGEVHDENCAALSGISGHAGLFGTGKAVVAYLRALGTSDVGRRLISENSARVVPGGDPLLGWRQRSVIPLPNLVIGHLGFTGTAFWLDKAGSSYGILLTNRVISGRKSPWMTQFRDDCMKLLELGLTP